MIRASAHTEREVAALISKGLVRVGFGLDNSLCAADIVMVAISPVLNRPLSPTYVVCFRIKESREPLVFILRTLGWPLLV